MHGTCSLSAAAALQQTVMLGSVRLQPRWVVLAHRQAAAVALAREPEPAAREPEPTTAMDKAPWGLTMRCHDGMRVGLLPGRFHERYNLASRVEEATMVEEEARRAVQEPGIDWDEHERRAPTFITAENVLRRALDYADQCGGADYRPIRDELLSSLCSTRQGLGSNVRMRFSS